MAETHGLGWYEHPWEGGAPQVGDLVYGHHFTRDPDTAQVGVLLEVDAVLPRWRMTRPKSKDWPAGHVWAHRVRRPTEAELAAWVLAQPGGAHG